MEKSLYESPFSSRYSSVEMQKIFSEKNKILVWRNLWIALSKVQESLGLPIKKNQIEEMESNYKKIDWDFIAQREIEVKHDVMAHVYGFGKSCPNSAAIIHLGATSADITDNADLIIYKSGLNILYKKLKKILFLLKRRFDEHKYTVCLGYTHFQSAQPISFSKRISFWMQDIILDCLNLQRFIQDDLKFKGFKGAVGNRASYIALFQANGFSLQESIEMAKKMSLEVAKKMGFSTEFSICSQIYTRKIDTSILNILSGIAESASKFACDIRLLSANRELSEPFEKNQIGSSAMPHKKNPIKSERICSLSRYVMGLPSMMSNTSANQWLERSLDDSALRRVIMPEAFLAIDGILDLYASIVSGWQVNISLMKDRVESEMPMIASEYLLMRLSTSGGGRQENHEKIRRSAVEARQKVMSGNISKENVLACWKQLLFEQGVDVRDTLEGILKEWPAWSLQPEVPDMLDEILSGYDEGIEDTVVKV